MKMVTLVLKSKPGIAYTLNEAKKTYSEVNTAQAAAETPERTGTEKFVAKKLASERVAGFDCVHVLLKGDKGTEFEVWSTREIGSAADYWANQQSSKASKSSLARALREGSADGWPVKWVERGSGEGVTTTWELVKADRKAVPASVFDLSRYTKGKDEGLGAMAGQVELSPEQQKQFDAAMKQQQEALKKMTPEQRKQYEEMMKSLQGKQQ
jgi:Spy/CpxP family protein refolding chaperone